MADAMAQSIAALRADHATFDQAMQEAIESGSEDELRAAVERARAYASNTVETVCQIMAGFAAGLIERQAAEDQ
jgi:hypothetical protein